MSQRQKNINRIGFIILGLTNNFGYVIMLSAAYDLLSPSPTPVNPLNSNSTVTPSPYCNPHSTSTILLADTMPSLLIKIVYPFLLVNVPTALKVIATIASSILSYVITGFSARHLTILTGVVFASVASGIGEVTLLSSTPQYGSESLSGWSIGTGMAGIAAFSYTILASHLETRTIMFIMVVVPLAMAFSYFYLISPTESEDNLAIPRPAIVETDSPDNSNSAIQTKNENKIESVGSSNLASKNYGTADNDLPFASPSFGSRDLLNQSSEKLSIKEKLALLPSLTKYFFPLLIVYFAEYFINQGLTEIIYFPEVTFLSHKEQYRWFQVAYQLGVMCSRSSIELCTIKNIWALSLLQMVNLVLFLAHTSQLLHIPSFYLVIAIIVYEGFLGGFCYINTFYRVTKELKPGERVFAISAVTMADSLGIVAAGFLSIPIHDKICQLYN